MYSVLWFVVVALIFHKTLLPWLNLSTTEAVLTGVAVVVVGNLLGFLGFFERRRSLAQSNGNFNVGSHFAERISQILGLRWGLRAPSNYSNVSDTFKGLGQQRKKIAPALDNGFRGLRQLDLLRLEDLRCESVPK